MRYSQEFRDAHLVSEIAGRIAALARGPTVIMEVCGTHTMSAARFGLKSLMPPDVKLVSGPGCPVCVTSQRDIDGFIALGDDPGNVLVSFGDMLRVPGSVASLEEQRARGADVRVVYSPLDAVDIARQEAGKRVVFFGVGFETTMPATAMAVVSAYELGLRNFSVFCCHKTMPAALRALLASGEVRVSGLLCPGHVTTIIGTDAYSFIPAEFGVPCAVAGFEPVDILLGIEEIVRQIAEGVPRVGNAYRRACQSEPNARAKALLEDVFTPCDAEWRGLGVIGNSGAAIAGKYADFDAQSIFADVLARVPEPVPADCRCGDVLRGVIDPEQCPQFGSGCSPENPLGPCMVSSEGACAAAYRYGGD